MCRIERRGSFPKTVVRDELADQVLCAAKATKRGIPWEMPRRYNSKCVDQLLVMLAEEVMPASAGVSTTSTKTLTATTKALTAAAKAFL